MNESDIKKMKNELKLEIQSTKESNNSDMRETGEMNSPKTYQSQCIIRPIVGF